MTDENERCWVLCGREMGRLWWARRYRPSFGEPCRVSFDRDWVMRRQEEKGDVLGFCHTHPSFSAEPSSTDRDTMEAWCSCFGRDLYAAIIGLEGTKCWRVVNDLTAECKWVECSALRFGNVLVGTTER